MRNVDIVETNVRRSFGIVKNDILELQKQMTELRREHAQLMELVGKMKAPKVKVVEKKKVVVKRAQQKFIGHKETKMLHHPNSMFAKNIKPKNRVVFKNKNTALNQGYKLAISLR